MLTQISKHSIPCIAICAALITGCATTSQDSIEEASGNSRTNEFWQRIPSDSTSSDSVTYFGFIDISQAEDGEAQYFEAGFAKFVNPAPLSLLLENFRQPAKDSCDYRQQTPGDSTPLEFKDELDFPGYPYDFVSTGSKIDVSVGSRRYAKLRRTSTNPEDAVQYETDVGSLPLSFGGIKLGDALLKTRGIRFTSSGKEFPAFTGIEAPPVDSIRKFKPDRKQRVTSDTRFRWRKGRYANDPDIRVQIEAGGGGRALFCAVADDGEFQLPAEVKNQLLDANMHTPFAFRDAIWFYLHQDALLIVSQSSYY